MMGGAIYLHTVYEDGSKLYFVLALEFTHKSEIFLCLHRLFGVSVQVFSGLFGDCLCSKGILRGALSGKGGGALWIGFIFADCGMFL